MTTVEIHVRSLTGYFHGIADAGKPEWPPSPFRLFQALRAGCTSNRQLSQDRICAALHWLEQLEPPTIVAPDATRLRGYPLYVPNNDIDSVRGDVTRVGEIKSKKIVTAQRFDLDAPVQYIWTDICTDTPEGLGELVTGLHTLGTGIDAAFASLIQKDHAVLPQSRPGLSIWRPGANAQESVNLAVPLIGSFDSIERRYAEFLSRFTRKGKKQYFSQPAMARSKQISYGNEPFRLVFSIRHDDSGSTYHAFTATRCDGLVAQLIDIVCRSYPDDNDFIERFIVGRRASSADLRRRVRFLPLPSRGHRHADGLVRRVLVEFPAGSPVRPEAVAWALEGEKVSTQQKTNAHTTAVGLEHDSVLSDEGILEAETTPVITTLEKLSYGRRSSCWRTVTPMVISPSIQIDTLTDKTDVNARTEKEHKLHKAVRVAVRQAGYPEPSAISLQCEPFGGFSQPAREYANGTRFKPDRLFHVGLRFPELVHGPVVIGDGRFRGLGLFEPVNPAGTGHYSFLLEPAVSFDDRYPLLRQFRRALMAQCGKSAKGRLPTLITGHEPNGHTARTGRHEHLYFAACVNTDRLISGIDVYLPHLIDRASNPPHPKTIDLLEQGLSNLNQLRFCQSVIALTSIAPTLLPRSTNWSSATRYVSTRRPRRHDDLETFMIADIERQLALLNVLSPLSVAVEMPRIQRNGLVSANIHVEFTKAVEGPFLLGQDAHFGGGMLQAND